ncbi:unnamed protein product, partial [Mesorhabditis spiculigera]
PLTDLNNSTFIYTGFFFDTNYYAQNIIVVAYTPYRLASTFEVVVKYTCILALLVDIFTLKRYSAYAAYDNGNQKHADVKYALQMITLHALSLAVLFEEVWGNIIFGTFDDLSMFAAWELFPEIWLLITGMVIVYYNHPESKKRRRRESKKPNGIPIAVFSLYQKSPMQPVARNPKSQSKSLKKGCAGAPQAPDYVSYCRLVWIPAEENAANSDPRGCWQYSWKRDPEIRAICENPVTMKNDGDLKPDNYPKEPRRLVAPESPGMTELMAIYITSDTSNVGFQAEFTRADDFVYKDEWLPPTTTTTTEETTTTTESTTTEATTTTASTTTTSMPPSDTPTNSSQTAGKEENTADDPTMIIVAVGLVVLLVVVAIIIVVVLKGKGGGKKKKKKGGKKGNKAKTESNTESGENPPPSPDAPAADSPAPDAPAPDAPAPDAPDGTPPA